jgi:hypothetical protein
VYTKPNLAVMQLPKSSTLKESVIRINRLKTNSLLSNFNRVKTYGFYQPLKAQNPRKAGLVPGQPTKAFRNRVLTNDHYPRRQSLAAGILQPKLRT